MDSSRVIPVVDPDKAIIDDILTAWQKAQRQLVELRDQVARHTHLAQAKIESNFLERDFDKALHDFGETVWKQVSRGAVELPGPLASAVKAMREAQRRVDAQNGEIADLLREGEDVARRLREQAKSTVAPKGKKR